METPKYFVQTKDGRLHGYYREDILRADLWANTYEDVKVYRLQEGGFTIKYEPVDILNDPTFRRFPKQTA